MRTTLLFIALIFVTVPAECEEQITIYYVNRVPYHYSDNHGNVQGLVATPVLEAFEKANIPYVLKELPAKRILFNIKTSTTEVCSMGWYKNPEREKFAKYSKPVYQNKSRIAITRYDNELLQSGGTIEETFKRPELTLLLKSGYSYGSYLDRKIASYNPKTYFTTKENDKMLQLVHLRKNNYFLLSEEEADALIPMIGYKKNVFKYIHFTDVPTGLNRYIIYSKQVDDAVIAKIDNALN